MKTTLISIIGVLLWAVCPAYSQVSEKYNKYIAACNAAIEQEDWEKALKYAKKANAENSVFWVSNFIIAELIMADPKAGSVLDARMYYQNVLNDKKSQLDSLTLHYTYKGLGMTYVHEDNYDKIAEYMTKATEFNDSCLTCYLALITCYQHKDTDGANKKSLKYTTLAYALDTNNVELLNNIGYGFMQINQYDTAIMYFDKLLKGKKIVNEMRAFPLNNRGYCRWKVGDTSGAKVDFDSSIVYYPTNPYVFMNKGEMLVSIGNTDDGCKCLKKANNIGFLKFYKVDGRAKEAYTRKLFAKYCED